MIKCRDDKNISNEHFKNSLYEKLTNNSEVDYNGFEEIVLSLLSSQAPLINFLRKKLHSAENHIINKETTVLN